MASHQIDNVNQTHDANGNLTNDGSQTYVWDEHNRLYQVKNGAGTSVIATYTYDVQNRRVRKDLPSGEEVARTEFCYDGWQVVEERYDLAPSGSLAPTVERQFVYGVYIDEPLIMDVNGNGDGDCTDDSGDPSDARYFYHQDALYSVAALSDTNGDVIEAYAYDPYGRHVRIVDGPDAGDSAVNFDSGPSADDVRTARDDTTGTDTPSPFGNPYTFTGRRYDPESAQSARKELTERDSGYYDKGP